MRALISGSGFENANFGRLVAEHAPQTDLGDASASILELEGTGGRLLWLRRHGEQGGIAPHRINYRGNLRRLADLGVNQIISVNTAGGINKNCTPGSLVIPDQVIDKTWARDTSFFDGEYLPLRHIDFTHPFDKALRLKIIDRSSDAEAKILDSGTYACVQGPRLETAAEIKALAKEGADLVGMTMMPEAALARELGIAYASICPIVNYAAGLGDGPLRENELREQAKLMVEAVVDLIELVLR